MRSKKVVCVLSVLILIASALITLKAKNVEGKDGTFGGGSGTSADPYIIEDVWDLQAMSNDLTAHYILKNDINASMTKTWNYGGGFGPIGHASAEFNGSLDGKGYNITGLVIKWPNVKHIGLIGYSGTSSSVKNLNLVDLILNSGDDMGGLIGYNRGEVLGSSVSGKVTGKPSFYGHVGGIVGTNIGSISRCDFSGEVILVGGLLTKGMVGGIVGYNTGYLDNCSIKGNISDGIFSDGSLGYFIGGAVGNNEGSLSNIKVEGNIIGYSHVGG